LIPTPPAPCGCRPSPWGRLCSASGCRVECMPRCRQPQGCRTGSTGCARRAAAGAAPARARAGVLAGVSVAVAFWVLMGAAEPG
jgi:hypothetical protein